MIAGNTSARPRCIQDTIDRHMGSPGSIQGRRHLERGAAAGGRSPSLPSRMTFGLWITTSFLMGCEPSHPEPQLLSVQPPVAYNDQLTRVQLQGANFIPSFTLDLEQGLRLPSTQGFEAFLQAATSPVQLTNVVWRSPHLLEADLPPTDVAGFSGAVGVTVHDPRGQQSQLSPGFISLGPDTTPPTLVVKEPLQDRPVAPGVLLPVVFSAEDQAPGRLVDMQYKIKWREQLLVDGRCELTPQPAATTCAFTAMVPSEALAQDVFQITLTALDGARVANATSQTLRFELKPNPMISGVKPQLGSSAGGTDLVVQGSHFDPSTQVFIGGQLLAPNGGRWIDAQTIAGRTPAGPPGFAAVELQSLTGSTNLGERRGFTYLEEPLITGVTPETAPAAGRVPISIRGVSFNRETIIVFGDRPTSAAPLLEADWVNPTEIRGLVPPGVGAAFVWAIDPLFGRTRWSGVFRWVSASPAVVTP